MPVEFRPGTDNWSRWAGAFGDFLKGLIPNPPPVTAPEPQAAAPQLGAGEEAPAAGPPAAPAAPKSTLDEFRSQLAAAKEALANAEAIANDPDQPPDVRQRAQSAAATYRALQTSITTQIAAEENRLRDEAQGGKTPTITQVAIPDQPGMTQPSVWDPKANDGKGGLVPALGGDGKPLPPQGTPQAPIPKNGDTRRVPVEHNGVQGTVEERYNNGAWSRTPNSFVLESGPLGQRQPTNKTVVSDNQGNYYTFDPETGGFTKAGGVGGPVYKLQEDGKGNTWLLNAQGMPERIVFDAAPMTQIVDNRLVMIDRNTNRVIANVDLLDPQQREQAKKLGDLALRRGEIDLQVAEQNLQPKFASAEAQLANEAQRRQGLARTELNRLLALQKEGQLSPDQAEAQFNAWMQTNVEAPLAGYRRAAEAERRELEQANLTRQRAEEARVEGLNRERGSLAFQAGEEARRMGMELGAQTRAPEYIQGLGDFARSLGQGRTDFQFSPEAFQTENYRKVLPNVDQMADAAVNRLFARVPAATARDVNVPLQPPAGDNLLGMMDGVRYTGPLTGAPNEQPLEGQGAFDLGNGMARSTYSGGRTFDWAIPQTAGAPAAVPPVPEVASVGLPGTDEERRARWAAILAR